MRDRSSTYVSGLRPLGAGEEEAESGQGLGAWDDFCLSGIGRNQALRKTLEVLGIHVALKES